MAIFQSLSIGIGLRPKKTLFTNISNVFKGRFSHRKLMMQSTDFVFYPTSTSELPSVELFKKNMPEVTFINIGTDTSDNLKSKDTAIYTKVIDNIQIDSSLVESFWLGREKYDDTAAVEKSCKNIRSRIEQIQSILSGKMMAQVSNPASIPVSIGDGGKYQVELDTAVIAVQSASFMSRSLQKYLLRSMNNSITKDDNSPVTIADFACQALIIDTLKRHFPNDRFIAEEDSQALREDPRIRDGVLAALRAATFDGNDDGKTTFYWTEEKLYSIIDEGNCTSTESRVWVLDPIDGTKGFMRGEHYCIALALMQVRK